MTDRLAMNADWRSRMRITLITAFAASIAMSTAHAGSNVCQGTVQVGKEWTTVKGESGDYAPEGCRFQTTSELGRLIIAACPDTSECMIDVPLTKGSNTITSITNVERLPPLKERFPVNHMMTSHPD